MAKQEYILPRNPDESSRLNAQHEVFKSAAGYLLHPRIVSSLTEPVSLADVATGTGIWLFDFASTLAPETWTLTGVDISDKQWKPPSNSPRKFNLELADLRQDIKPELHGKYDVVHIRALIGGLTTSDWAKVMENTFRMLKPGGWLQWQEINPPRWEVVALEPEAPVEHSWRLIHESSRALNRAQKWLLEDMDLFISRLEAAGYEDCKLHRSPSDREPKFRTQSAQVMIGPMRDGLKHIQAIDEGLGLSVSEIDAMVKGAWDEMEDGKKAYMRWDFYTFTAQKPSN